jgi:hypothetical protein
LVKIFNSLQPIRELDDTRLQTIKDVLHFFEQWEAEAKLKKMATASLMSAQCREDVQCTLLGFLELCCHHFNHYATCIVPGRVNSDIVENTYVTIYRELLFRLHKLDVSGM